MLVEHGFTLATLDDGTEFSFTPSLGRVARLGTPREIVEQFARLHGPGAVSAAREVLAVFCDQGAEALPRLIGKPYAAGLQPLGKVWGAPPPRWKPGAMPDAHQVAMARHLMVHAVSGARKPDAEQDDDEGGDYVAEFDVGRHIAAARVHLGLSEAEAEACSMTQLLQLFAVKFPKDEERKRRNAPTLAELEATERDVAQAEIRRAARKAMEEAAHGG